MYSLLYHQILLSHYIISAFGEFWTDFHCLTHVPKFTILPTGWLALILHLRRGIHLQQKSQIITTSMMSTTVLVAQNKVNE